MAEEPAAHVRHDARRVAQGPRTAAGRILSSAREKLLARRAWLVAQAETERAELAERFGVYERPLLAIDRAISVLRAMRANPILRYGAAAAMAALAFVRPRSIVGWVIGGRAIWKLFAGIRSRVEARRNA